MQGHISTGPFSPPLTLLGDEKGPPCVMDVQDRAKVAVSRGQVHAINHSRDAQSLESEEL